MEINNIITIRIAIAEFWCGESAVNDCPACNAKISQNLSIRVMHYKKVSTTFFMLTRLFDSTNSIESCAQSSIKHNCSHIVSKLLEGVKTLQFHYDIFFAGDVSRMCVEKWMCWKLGPQIARLESDKGSFVLSTQQGQQITHTLCTVSSSDDNSAQHPDEKVCKLRSVPYRFVITSFYSTNQSVVNVNNKKMFR